MYKVKFNLVKNIISNSYYGNESHIPSALSMLNYVYEISKLINPNETNLVIGKPFGAMAYYEIWKKLGWISENTDMLNLPPVIKDKNTGGFDFVDFSVETMGNSLGVATGYAYTKDKFTWVNISDAALQMGSELEAILHISQLSKDGLPLLITVDNNNSQVCGDCDDINSIQPVIDMMKASNIQVFEFDDASILQNDFTYQNKSLQYAISRAKVKLSPAVCIIFNTKKGYPFERYMNNAPKYHYQKLDERSFGEMIYELEEYADYVGAEL